MLSILGRVTGVGEEKISWGCRIHRLQLCREVRPFNKCPGYDIKKFHSEVPVMLELCGIRSTSPLPSLPRSHWPGVVAPDCVLSMGQIELFDI